MKPTVEPLFLIAGCTDAQRPVEARAQLALGDARAPFCRARRGERVAVLEGAGHWWMCQQPKQAADAITAFLANLNS